MKNYSKNAISYVQKLLGEWKSYIGYLGHQEIPVVETFRLDSGGIVNEEDSGGIVNEEEEDYEYVYEYEEEEEAA